MTWSLTGMRKTLVLCVSEIAGKKSFIETLAVIFYLHFCECLLVFVSLGKQKMDHYILAHQGYISSPVSSQGSHSTI